MKTLILYGSQYGAARRYAEKLADMTGLPAVSYEKAGDLSSYRQIVYLGGLYAGGVKGLKQTARRFPAGVRLVLATVGLADPQDEKNIWNIRSGLAAQLPAPLLQEAAIFHLRGGIDYSRLNPLHRTMMTLLCGRVKKIPPAERDAETRAMLETFNKKVDFVDFAALEPVMQAIQT